ncbi:MAG: hypothetical protein B6U73_02750 [Desulfurococcales archaeon ex4484_204]|nr:MAG: hypothetical protein B6U73_02750 [Desulfurococcales archaeon ex4484_204]
MGSEHLEGLTERELVERLRAIILFRKYLNPSLIDFIEQVQSYEFIPEITRVAEDMGLHASTVWKFMNLLRSKGFSFTAVIDIGRLGLEEVVLVFDDYIPYEGLFKSTLRFYAPVVPWGSVVSYIIPKGMCEAFINEIAPTIPKEPVEVIRLTYTLPVKSSLAKYYNLKERRVRLNWDELFREIIATPREVVPRESARRGRFDEIDMFILRELELNPFISLKKITERYNRVLRAVTPINYIRVLRHYKNHIEARGVVRGVKLRLTPIFEVDSVPTISVIRGNPADIHRVGRVLALHPYFTSARFNPAEGVGLLESFMPLKELFNLSMFMRRLERERVIREWRSYILDIVRHRMFTLPTNIFSEPITEIVKRFKKGEELVTTVEIREKLVSPDVIGL